MRPRSLGTSGSETHFVSVVDGVSMTPRYTAAFVAASSCAAPMIP